MDTSDFTWLVEWTLAVASVCALVAAIAAVADLVILLVDAVPVTATHVGVLSGCFSGGLVKGEVYPKIKFSPVVVFWVLSRMVLVRGSCDAPFLLESQSNSRTSTETG